MTFRKLHFFIVLAVIAPTLATSCQNEPAKQRNAVEADSLINVAYKMRDYQKLLSIVDLHQSQGSISKMKGNYWKGYAYSRMRQTPEAEKAWREAVSLAIDNDEDLKFYTMSSNRLAGLLYLQGNYEGTIRVAMKSMQKISDRDYTNNIDFANMLAFVGCCQVKLQRLDQADENFTEAWEHYLKATDGSTNISDFTGSLVGIIAITDAYIQTGQYKMGFEWTQRLEDMLSRYRQQPMANDDYIDKQWARLNFYRACALEGLNNKEDAEKAYNTALTTRYAKTGDGKIEATTYLMQAQRWKEAADMFSVLEKQIKRYDLKFNLDNILMYMQPQFKANLLAGHRDSAIAEGVRICLSLDSAIILERQNSAIEQSTIYETEGKEREQAEASAAQSHQLLLMNGLLLGLLIIGFAGFLYYRHRKAISNELSMQRVAQEIDAPLHQILQSTQRFSAHSEPLTDDDYAQIDRDIKSSIDGITNMINQIKQQISK